MKTLLWISEFALMGMLRYTHSFFQKGTNPESKQYGVYEFCTELGGTVDVWLHWAFKRSS